jgi:glutathione S-transferase
MKLYFNPASPFVRKVLMLAHECALFSELELVPVAPLPTKPVAELSKVNPLGKVPTLVTPDGVLFDSRVIAEYLDSRSTTVHLFPAGGSARWLALRRQAEADGLMDAAVSMRYERVIRPADLVSDDWLRAQWTKVAASLDAFEAEAATLPGDLTIGCVAIASALGYLDFRFADRPWRSGRPALAAFHATIGARASYAATAPPAH